MKPKSRWHVGWILFALLMVWGECVGDVPRLLDRNEMPLWNWLMAFGNLVAVLGLTFYVLRLDASRAFWRLYAPIYATLLAWQAGVIVVRFTQLATRLFERGQDAVVVLGPAFVVAAAVAAMAGYTLVALFRLGDWIGPTRRPVGVRQPQLSLPL